MDDIRRLTLPEVLIVLAVLLSWHSKADAAEKQNGDCHKKAATIKIGMTRGEIEARMEHDGGLAGIYKGERLFFNEPGGERGNDAKGKYCMLTIDFRPYRLPNEIYQDANRFAEWITAKQYHPDAKDVAVKISTPFVDYRHTD